MLKIVNLTLTLGIRFLLRIHKNAQFHMQIFHFFLGRGTALTRLTNPRTQNPIVTQIRKISIRFRYISVITVTGENCHGRKCTNVVSVPVPAAGNRVPSDDLLYAKSVAQFKERLDMFWIY